MSDTWIESLRAGRVLLLDGGTGTELRRRGFPMHADVWSARAALTHFDLLRAVHLEHIEAGADVITTNTFATSRFVLEGAGLGAEFEMLNRRTIQAAVEARELGSRDVAIAVSMSCLPPRFDSRAYPRRAAERDAYRELAALAAEAGADLLALEMLQDTEHAPLACEAARESGLPFWIGVSCRQRGGALVAFDFPRLPFTDCLEALLGYEPAAVNIMHSPRAAIAPALAAVRERWDGRPGAYPALPGNGALEQDVGEPVTPRDLAVLAAEWVKHGARIVGGCCGTTPDYVRALRAALDERAEPR